jgi:succinyl-diaminopimelate desuccinylase
LRQATGAIAMEDERARDIGSAVEALEDGMVRFLSDLIAVPSIGPSSGGDGEWDRVEMIEARARAMGFADIQRLDVDDPSVPSGKRPNLVVWLRRDAGRVADGPRLLIVTHTDVVPPGNLKDWTGGPFLARVEDGKIIGRGAEDNGQAITAALFAAKAILDLGLRPAIDVGLVMVADEEVENAKGIGHLVEERFFRKDDLVLVPDHGEPEGRLVDVSEKALAWVKVTTRGKQCHPSMPKLGINAHRAAMMFGVSVDEALHARFGAEDSLFDHPISSFEPTKKEANVENVNMVPGEDVFYIDCRLLPQYGMADMLAEMRNVADLVEAGTGAKIALEPILMDEAAPPTPVDAPVVQRLLRAIDAVHDNDPYPGGIGGGTCAAYLRRAGLNAAVWETVANTAHAPDEYAVVANMVGDAKVFAHMFLDRT